MTALDTAAGFDEAKGTFDTAALLDLTRNDVVIDLRDGGTESSVLKLAHEQPLPAAYSQLQRAIWRSADIALATAIIIATAPVMLTLFLAVSLTSRGGPLFLQERVGRSGAIFRCAKFRTMRSGSEQLLADVLANDPAAQSEWLEAHKLRSDPRITKLGRLLRRTNLDELPQFFNVISGSMSIVGPRPVVPVETLRYGNSIRTVLSVKPGITGLWQVSGRNDLTYSERVELDLTYVENKSLRTDAGIVLRTVSTMISGRGNGAY